MVRTNDDGSYVTHVSGTTTGDVHEFGTLTVFGKVTIDDVNTVTTFVVGIV